MTTTDTPGERLFREYLEHRHLSFEREPSIGGRNPDFVIDTAVGKVAAEVYEPRFDIPPGGGSFDSVKPITKAFTGDKRKQTQAARDAGLPAIIVIGSDNAPLPYNMLSVMGAMFGREGIAIPVNEEIEKARHVRLGGAKVQPTFGTSVSAIALFQRFCPTNSVVHNAWREAGIDPGPPSQSISLDDALAQAQRQHKIATDLIHAGLHDPRRWLPRLVIAHNPYAVRHLPLEFAGCYDVQYDAVELRPGVGHWLLAASGRLANQVVATF